METYPTPQIQEESKGYLFRVTPPSKALASILFIALPFLGFWLGMNYENLSTSNEVEEVISEDTSIQPTVTVLGIEGKKFGDFTFEQYATHDCGLPYPCESKHYVFTGTTTVTGYFITDVMDGPLFMPLESELRKFPLSKTGIDNFDQTFDDYMWLMGSSAAYLREQAQSLSTNSSSDKEVLMATIEISGLQYASGSPKSRRYGYTELVQVISTSTSTIPNNASSGL